MRRAVLAAPSVLAALLQACGGGGSPTTTTPTTTQPPCTQSVVLQSGFQGLGSYILVDLPFTTTATGRLDVTVDWTWASSPRAVYLVRGSCSIDQVNARTCDFVLRSEPSTTPKPHRLSASNVAAGSFDLMVGNAGTQDESVTAQVVVSSATCPAITAVRSGASRILEIEGAYWRSRLRQ
jgi:hypothetical protein